MNKISTPRPSVSLFASFLSYNTSQTIFLSLIFFLGMFPYHTIAQLSVHPDRATAQYKVGESMQFEISSSSSGTATYTLSYDARTPVIETGTVEVSAGSTKRISFQSPESGIVQCVVNQGNNWASTAAAFGAYEIAAFEDEPDDFDSFWNSQKAALAAIDMDPQVSFHSNTASSKTYKVSLKIIDNRRVYGYITIPDGTGTFPALMTLPAFGDGANLTSPQDFVADAAKAISVSMSIHNTDPTQSDPNAYEPNNITDREGLYYRYGILGAIRMIDYIFTREEFDGQSLGLMGVSQGAGLGIMVAGLDNRVNLLMNSNPILAQQTGLKYEQPSGFPYYIWQSRTENGSPTHEIQTIEAIKYYDPIYFAERFEGASMMFISYKDATVPPATSFAAYNALGGEKVLMHSLDLGHVHPPEYWNGRYDFIRRHFPATIHNPFQNTTGFGADTGENQSIELDESVSLTAQVEENDSPMNNLPARWTKVSGPGEVDFSNSTSYTTNASFSEVGTYVLRFAADDLQKLAGEAKYYTISNDVTIVVEEGDNNGGGNGNGNGGNGNGGNGNGGNTDTEAPEVELTFLNFDEDGNLLIMVNFNENITGLWFNDFVVTNGTIMDLTGFDGEYLLVIAPEDSNIVEVFVEEDGVTDAAGNGNMSSDLLLVQIPDISTCTNVTSGGVISGNETECSAFSAQMISSISLPEGSDNEVEYKWQKSTISGNGPWQDVGEADEASYQVPYVTQTTWYRRLARKEGCGEYAGISNVIIKEISSDEGSIISTADYCSGKGAEPWWQWIKKVQIGDFSNTSSKESYGDFTAQSIRVIKGEEYPVQLVPGFSGQAFNEYWKIWIDLNQDGDFYDSGETVYSNRGESMIEGDIYIPTTAKSGITRLRIAMKNGGYANACEEYTYGEMEDYSIFISNNAQTNYCEPRGEQPWTEWIRKVVFGDIENRSGKDQYGDFTGMKTIVNTSQSYPIILDADFETDPTPVHWRVWIDFNQDGDFEDVSEMVFAWYDDRQISGHVYIPAYAAAGITRMRVAMKKGDYASSCETFDFGEVEDYSIQIQECGANQLFAAATLELRAEKEDLSTQLYWVTNTEYKNDYFVLERSLDGVNFEAIQEVTSKNDDYLLPSTYREVDAAPLVGINYYRLKQIYKNGLSRYSNIQEVVFQVDIEEFSVFPNPAGERLYLNLKSFLYEPADIRLYNRFGQEIQHIELEYVPEHPVHIDLKGRTNGLYYVTVKVDGYRTLSQKFVIGQKY